MRSAPTELSCFQGLVEDHGQAVTVFVRGLLAPSEVDDCVQETFLAALRAYPRFDGAHPRAWLLSIARNKAIDAHRARGRRPEPVADAEERLAAPVEVDGEGGELWEEIAELPFKQRAAVVLRFGVDLRYREIGVAMGTSEAAARRNVHEAIGKLREARGVAA